jgi:bile acid:Na+ symporter, BASS family
VANAANPILRFLSWSGREGSMLLAVGIFAGALIPPLAAAFRDLVTPTVLGMMTLVLLRVDVPGTIAHLRRPLRVALIVVVQLVISPVVAWVAVSSLGLDQGIADGVAIFAAGCASTASPAFARMVGLDPELALIVSLITTALVPLTAPPIALWLMGIDLSISVVGFMARLLFVVGLPALLSLALRHAIGPARLVRWGDAVDGILVWIVVFFGFGVMDGLAARAERDPAWVAEAILAAFVASYGLNLLTTVALRPLGARIAATAGLMSGNRNMALFLAALPATTDPRISLFFALYQFALFLSPFLLRPVYRRLPGLAPAPRP